MDFKKWMTNNKWIVLLLLYGAALIIQVINNGASVFGSVVGIGLIIAIISTFLDNSRKAKQTLRACKHFFGYGMFKWEAIGVFTVRKEQVPTLFSKERVFKEIAEKSLKNSNITLTHDSVQTSFDRLSNLKVFIEKYVMYLDISLTDAEIYDDDGKDLVYITIRTVASLRYRDNNKAINGILLDFYYFFEKEFIPSEEKYTVIVEPENMPKDYLVKQFLIEHKPNEVESFNILSKSTSTVEKISHRNITLTTDRREILSGALKKLVLKIA
ncbi:hypothetical protein AB685_00455 [Bacillus sp. LL01]|uniref:hypothetical protein n=1 Tax=Bacillus sp. LL01 TaxID=1665556 RepID=UPI00064D6ABC|nr:hypothetical protein [Bacillus sp. LL01]KMJ59397.1 hypothetical protein AB685_00455 [Bacillus sp. LL01]